MCAGQQERPNISTSTILLYILLLKQQDVEHVILYSAQKQLPENIARAHCDN